MRRLALAAVAAAAALFPALRARASSPRFVPSWPFSLPGLPAVPVVNEWTPAPAAFPYLFAVEQTESKYGIPRNLLARLIEQESAWDPGAYNKGSDASGIAQIVPKWHPNVDPWDALSAIDYAGFYLSQNFERFGTWDRALAAYNWGPTNVDGWIQAGESFVALPLETQGYVDQITGDVPV